MRVSPRTPSRRSEFLRQALTLGPREFGIRSLRTAGPTCFVDDLICSLVGELSRCLAALPAMRLGDPRAAADYVGVRVDLRPELCGTGIRSRCGASA